MHMYDVHVHLCLCTLCVPHGKVIQKSEVLPLTGLPPPAGLGQGHILCQVQFLHRTEEVWGRWFGWSDPVLYLSLASGRRAAGGLN